VLIRTGTLRYWGETGADHEKIKEHDSAGMSLDATKHLVEQHGAIIVGSDTSGYESWPPPDNSKSFMPSHNYLLIQQGVHIAEFQYLEDLAKDKAYEFLYICLVNKIKGATAGFTLRPVAIR
jgi:kynurenine formamidase